MLSGHSRPYRLQLYQFAKHPNKLETGLKPS
jgi:hypothetical protein